LRSWQTGDEMTITALRDGAPPVRPALAEILNAPIVDCAGNRLGRFARPSVAGRTRTLIASWVAAILVAGCASQAGVRPTDTMRVVPSASASEPIAAPTAATTLFSCLAPVDVRALHVVRHFNVSPDDIAVGSSGRIWITAREANLLISLSPSGSVISTQTVAGGPEGIAAVSSDVYVAQQNLNAIAAIIPEPRKLITFPNRTRNAGIDGISHDATLRQLLVPDSPTGQLFAVPLTGPSTPRLLAANLGRPVAVTSDSSGDIFVASESSPALVELTPAGTRRTLGRFADLDEVVEYAGLLYATELDRHDVVAIDPTSGASHRIAVNLPSPQGLAVTAAGILEVVDASTDTVYSIPACGARG
jgi:sugar lactone lactonase YvrE